jgi:hypothetical protein
LVVLVAAACTDEATLVSSAPTAAGLRALAKTNGGFVNFHVDVFRANEFIGTWNFSRQIAGDEWFGRAPSLVISPTGSQELP